MSAYFTQDSDDKTINSLSPHPSLLPILLTYPIPFSLHSLLCRVGPNRVRPPRKPHVLCSPDGGASDGWERQRHENREAHRGARSLSPQPNRFRTRDFRDTGGNDGNEEDDTDDDDGQEERKDEDDFGEVGERGERQQRVTRKFFVGQWLDVKDTVNNWLEATIMDITDSGETL